MAAIGVACRRILSVAFTLTKHPALTVERFAELARERPEMSPRPARYRFMELRRFPSALRGPVDDSHAPPLSDCLRLSLPPSRRPHVRHGPHDWLSWRCMMPLGSEGRQKSAGVVVNIPERSVWTE